MQVHVRVASLGLDLVHDPEGGSASTLLDSRMINVDVDADIDLTSAWTSTSTLTSTLMLTSASTWMSMFTCY